MAGFGAKIVNKIDEANNNSCNCAYDSSLTPKRQQRLERSSTEPRFCQDKFYEECPSSAITDTIYTAGVTGMDFWEVSKTSLNGGKNFSSGRVELQIRDQFDLEDFAEIAYQAKEVIAQQFGEQTLKLHYALAAIAFRKPESWKEEITVSASKLLADFGEDKKKRNYIPKAERNSDGKSTRYFSKEEKLRQIAHHGYLLKRLEVWVQAWRVRSKGIFTVEMSNLWEIFTISEVVQKGLEGKNTLIDIEITYRPGLWFKKFAGHEYLREFGYLTSEALKLDPYREKMALRLAYFALFALQQHKSGRYQIETLLGRIGYGQEIETAKTDRNTASNLKRGFDRALKTLGNFQHPYAFNYDLEVPDWAHAGSKTKKPKHWFETWLKLYGTLRQPEALPKRQSERTKQQARKSKKHKSVNNKAGDSNSLTFGQKLRKARQIKGESLRGMAKQLGISPSRLSQIENDRYPHPLKPNLKAKFLTHLGLDE